MANTYASGEQTKQNIKNISKKLFYEKGYTETTYSDISVAANVNRALIPYHFKNKHILGIDIYQEIMNNFYNLIDNVLDTSQFNSNFISILHTVSYYRLLADNSNFTRFLSELHADETATIYSSDKETEWLLGLGSKFTNLEQTEINILTKMHIGIKKEMLELISNNDNKHNADTISCMHINMLMRYVGYSAKKIDELLEAAFEVVNLFTFQISDNFDIQLKYK